MTDSTEVASSLERLLRGEISAVILQAGEAFVQFAESNRDELVIEAAGDDVLPERLTPNQLRMLHDLGFTPPGRSTNPNHARLLARATPAAELARLAMGTLTTVYGPAAADVAIVEV